MMSHFTDASARIGLLQALAQSARVDLYQPTLLLDEMEVSGDPPPYAGHALEITVWLVAKQTNQVEMAYDPWLQCLQHLVMSIKVVLEQFLVRAAGNGSGLLVHRPVVVYRDLVHVVNAADEEINVRLLHHCADERGIFWSDPLRLEADNDYDLTFVFLSKPDGLGDIFLPQRKEEVDNILRRTALFDLARMSFMMANAALFGEQTSSG